MTNNSPKLSRTLDQEIGYYLELSDYLPINKGLASATQGTMISLLGSPLMPLNTDEQPERVIPLAKNWSKPGICKNVDITAIRPALDSLEELLKAAIQYKFSDKSYNHDRERVLGTDCSLVMRVLRPISGLFSDKISNYSCSEIYMKLTGCS